MSTDRHLELLDSNEKQEKSGSQEHNLLTRRGQSHLRLVFSRDESLEDPRKCAQSTSGLNSSQVTSPRDSRSMLIASDSPQGLSPYATLRRWPAVVPQRSANDSRSARDRAFKNVKRSIPEYHHMVNISATPFVEFTKRCTSVDNEGMESDRLKIQEVRRENTRRVVERFFRGNQAALARAYNPANPDSQATRSYINDLLKDPPRKNFGEKASWKIEDAVGLRRGQLSIPNSPLELDPHRLTPLIHEIQAEIDDLEANVDLEREILAALRHIKARHRRIRKAG